MWRADGRELFYRDDRQIMAVDVTLGPVPTFGNARLLFEVPGGNSLNRWIVSADGERFLFPQSDRLDSITLIVNWTSLLEENQ